MDNLFRFPRIIILSLLISFATFLGILVTPAIPQIAQDFGISEVMAQWTMSIFLIGYSLGQLPYGPLANRFGRKKAIYIGVVIALIGSSLAYVASSFWVLCVARFIQALGSGVGLKIAFTMIGDLHSGRSASKALAMLSIAFGIMPGLAAAIGGSIVVISGWSGCFLFLIFYTFALGGLCFLLPETAPQLQKDALELGKIGHGLLTQFRDPKVFFHAFLAGLASAIIYIFTTLSPLIAMNQIGLNPAQFGFWAFVPSLGLLSGALVARALSQQNRHHNMAIGILIIASGAIFLSFFFAKGQVNVWTLFIPLYVMNIGNNLTWANASTKGLSEATDKSNGSAMVQFINMSIATLGVFLIEVVPPSTIMLLPVALGIIITLMILTWLKVSRH
jgi:DHA1 family bicyclomycin/chloramphenicol resistance-like MFS transporter